MSKTIRRKTEEFWFKFRQIEKKRNRYYRAIRSENVTFYSKCADSRNLNVLRRKDSQLFDPYSKLRGVIASVFYISCAEISCFDFQVRLRNYEWWGRMA